LKNNDRFRHINKLLNVSITALNSPTVMFPQHSVKGLGLDSQDLSAVSLVNKQAHSQGLYSNLWKKARNFTRFSFEESLYFLGMVQPFLSFIQQPCLLVSMPKSDQWGQLIFGFPLVTNSIRNRSHLYT
jgi:hypothetical protein